MSGLNPEVVEAYPVGARATRQPHRGGGWVMVTEHYINNYGDHSMRMHWYNGTENTWSATSVLKEIDPPETMEL